MSPLDPFTRELIFLIIQYLGEEAEFKETIHTLEMESGTFFNMKYFEDAVTNGDWDEVEKYLSGFTKVDDNQYSTKIFFEIWKQKYLEALDRKDHPKALEILKKGLKVFSATHEGLFKEMTLLLTLNDFRENEQLAKYGDTKSARTSLLDDLKTSIEKNPLFGDKLQLPSIDNSRLWTLINESHNWQHYQCMNPNTHPNIKTLFEDHTCWQPNASPAPSMPHPAIFGGPIGLSPPNNAASMLKRPTAPPDNNPALEYQTQHFQKVPKRQRCYGEPAKNGDNTSNLPDVETRISYQLEKPKIWKLSEISEPTQLRTLKLPDKSLTTLQIVRLRYTKSGGAILALTYNALHKLWKWKQVDRYTRAKATTSAVPQLWKPSRGISMTNDISETKIEEAVPCFAVFSMKKDYYLISSSGGKISRFTMMSFKKRITFMPPPPAATSLAFHPYDYNVIAIGMDDSSIQIYNVFTDEMISKLKGHEKKVTGLAFSNVLKVLVSSGADAQLCVWSMDGWEKKDSKFLQNPLSRAQNPVTQTHVEFHQDQIHMLAANESQIAIYDTYKLECKTLWVPEEPTVAITNAVFSCDSQSVYACFDDGSVNVFSASASALKLRCHINPTAYLPSTPCTRAFPLTIAAHPSLPNQFALGLTDGSVHVLEPLESEGQWGIIPPQQNAAESNTSTFADGSGSNQPSRL